MKILAIAAHPDDEIYAAGLLAKYADEGHHVFILMTTRGEGAALGSPPICSRADLGHIREGEARLAAAILGAHEISFLPYVDPVFDGELRAIDASLEAFSQSMQEVLTRILPEIIITHGSDGEYGHPQHLFTHQAVFHALQQMLPWQPQKVLTWNAAHPQTQTSGETNLSDPADVLIDIRPWAAHKMEAFQAHRTQFPFIEKFALASDQPVAEFEIEAYRSWKV